MDGAQSVASLPKDWMAERASLACLMRANDEAASNMLFRLREEWYDNGLHREAFVQIRQLRTEGRATDLVMLRSRLLSAKIEERAADELCENLSGLVPAWNIWKGYAEILEDRHARRKMIESAQLMRTAAMNLDKPWKASLEQTEASLFELHVQNSHRGMVHVGNLAIEVAEEINQVIANRGHVTNGLALGMTAIDRALMGLKPGFYVVAARPSTGKTVFGCQILLNVGLGSEMAGDYKEFRQDATPCGFFSLETRDANLVKRMVLNRAKISIQKSRDGLGVTREQQDALTQAVRQLVDSKIYVEAAFGMTIQQLRAKARLAVARYGLKLIVIDYLQLLGSSSRGAVGNRNQAMIDVSTGLKELAEELQIPVISLAQVNRDGADKLRPNMADIKDSGQIEQDADGIFILCRAPEWAGKDDPEDAPWGWIGVDLVKNKDGPTTSGVDPFVLRFDKEFFRMESVDDAFLSNNKAKHQKGYHQEEERKSEGKKPWKPAGPQRQPRQRRDREPQLGEIMQPPPED